MEPRLDDFEYQLRTQQEFSTPGVNQTQSTTPGTYVDPSDGTVYEWDHARKGWFPKVDDNFLAAYHASYGVPSTESGTFAVPSAPPTRFMNASQDPPKVTPSDTSTKDDVADSKAKESATKRKNTEGDDSSESKKPKPNEKKTPTWFEMDDEKNLNVYVSGLPNDVTIEEFKEMMSKYGIIMENEDGTPKLKLYKDSDGEVKGDGLCCYLKAESIPLVLNILDGSTVRGHTISVQRAKFVQKGEYNPKLKRKKPKKKGSRQNRLLDWKERRVDGPSRKKCERIIVFKNVFDPKQFDEDPTLITDIRSDLQEECGKLGTVKKILLFDRHPEGIASVAFAEFEAADMCVQAMNGRFYGGRQLEVEAWDGIINFQVEETDQEREQRLEKWEKFLKEGEATEDKEQKSDH